MKNFTTLRLDQKVEWATLAITNAQRNEAIMAAIPPYHYNEERLQEGEQLVADLKELIFRWIKAQGMRRQATMHLEKTWKKVRDRYRPTRKVGHLLFTGNAPLRRALGLDEQPGRALSSWLTGARMFYMNALETEEVLSGFARFGITREQLAQEPAMLEEIETAIAAQEQAAAAAMRVTRERWEAVKKLEVWMHDFIAILRIAMGHSQWLEAVGIVVKSDNSRKSAKRLDN